MNNFLLDNYLKNISKKEKFFRLQINIKKYLNINAFIRITTILSTRYQKFDYLCRFNYL